MKEDSSPAAAALAILREFFALADPGAVGMDHDVRSIREGQAGRFFIRVVRSGTTDPLTYEVDPTNGSVREVPLKMERSA